MPIPLVMPYPGTSGGATRSDLVDMLADELGFFQPCTTTGAASGGDPTRVAISDELRDDEVGYDWGVSGQWLYVADGAQAGAQRRILMQPDVGYQGQRSAVVVSRPFAAALASGVALKVTSPLPVVRSNGTKGLAECIDEALGMILVPARITMTGNATYAYDLADYPWLTDMSMVRGFYDSRWGDSTAEPAQTGFGGRIVQDGVSRTLVTESLYQTTDAWYLDVIVPADRLVYDGAGWDYTTTPGLLEDEYATAAPARWVLAFAMVTALRYLERLVRMRGGVSPDDRRAAVEDIQRRRRQYARAAADIKMNEFPRPMLPRSKPLVWGATSAWSPVERPWGGV